MKQALVILHVWDNPAGYVGEILQDHHIAYNAVNVEEEPLPDLTAYDAIIALGGPQHVYEEDKFPYFKQEKALLREVIAQDIPYLGLCLGGQLLASALGSPVKRLTTAEFGFVDVQLTEEGKRDPLYQGLPGYQRVFQWHEDTFELPAESVHLAANGHTVNQAFRYGRRSYGLQYHIEVSPELLDLWLSHPNVKQEIINSFGLDAYHGLEQARITEQELYYAHTRTMFENFLRISELI